MTKHAGGRPLKFQSVKELQEKIDAYFADCDPHPEEYTEYIYAKKTIRDDEGKDIEVPDTSKRPTTELHWGVSRQRPYTITGLANFLGTSRETLINYENRDEFFDTIKGAKDKCEQYWELQLLGPHATGPIFNLKNNYGWKDKTEQDLTSDGERIGISAEQSEQLIRARARRSNT